jgi:hypothetical protein
MVVVMFIIMMMTTMMMMMMMMMMYLCSFCVPSRYGNGTSIFYLYLAWNRTPRYLDDQATG